MSETKSASLNISTSSRLWANDIGLIAQYTTDTLPPSGKLEVWEDEHGSFDLRQTNPDRQPEVLEDGSGVRFNSYHMDFMTSMDASENLQEIVAGEDRLSIVVVARVSDKRIPTIFEDGNEFDRHPTNVGTFMQIGSTRVNMFRDLSNDELDVELTTKKAQARWETGVSVSPHQWRAFVLNLDSAIPKIIVDGDMREPNQTRGSNLQSRDSGPLKVGFWQRDEALLDMDIAAILVFRQGPSLYDLQTRADALLQKIYPIVNMNTASSLSAEIAKTVEDSSTMQTTSSMETNLRVDLNDLEDIDIWYSALDERLEASPIATWHDLSPNDQNLQMLPDQSRQPLYVDSETDIKPVVRFPDTSVGSTPIDQLNAYTIFISQRAGSDRRQLPMYITSALQVWLRRPANSNSYNLVIIANPGFLSQRSMIFEEIIDCDEFFDLFLRGSGGNDLRVYLGGQEVFPDDIDTVWNGGYPLEYSTEELDATTATVPTSFYDPASWITTKGQAPIVSGSTLISSGQSNTTGDVRTFEIEHTGLLVLGEATDSEYAQFALFRRELSQDERDFVRGYFERHHK